MSFANAPVTFSLVAGLIASSIATSVFDIKHHFYIIIDLHFWRYRQFWRAFVFQLCYTNASEVLLAVLSLYQMRVVERMWGSRKFASFVLMSWALSSVITPAVLSIVLWPMTQGFLNYLPAGPTPVIFAILAQYHAIVPRLYQYCITTWPAALPSTAAEVLDVENDSETVTLSDKSYRYALAVHLAVLQWPPSLLGAAVGWLVGYAWRSDLLPPALTRWRVPGWLVGAGHSQRDQLDDPRRRLEGETSAAVSGVDVSGEGDPVVGRQWAGRH